MSVSTSSSIEGTDTAVQGGGVSRRHLLRLALAGSGVVAAGPTLSRLGLFSGTSGVDQQGTVAGVISGDAPMKGPVVKKFDLELVRLEEPSGRPRRRQEDEREVRRRAGRARRRVLRHRAEGGHGPAAAEALPGDRDLGLQRHVSGAGVPSGAERAVHSRQERQQPTAWARHLHPPARLAHAAGARRAPGRRDVPGLPGHPTPSRCRSSTTTARRRRTARTHVYRYPNGEDTRTLWYHDHGMHQTAEQVYKGLVGMFIQEPDPEMRKRRPGAARLYTDS